MADTILVCTAWPYVNGSLHVGHLAGVYVPADTFARFERLRGNNVLMVSGSDEHGTRRGCAQGDRDHRRPKADDRQSEERRPFEGADRGFVGFELGRVGYRLRFGACRDGARKIARTDGGVAVRQNRVRRRGAAR